MLDEAKKQHLGSVAHLSQPGVAATGKAAMIGGVRFTIKDGIVYDAKALLADVKAMVDAQKAKAR